MKPNEPPRLAQWALEHCTPPGRDEALAGDLLEEYRAGRSSRWYRQQVLSTVVIGWMRVLGARGVLLLFAVLWSSLAPAWTALLDHAVSRPNPAEEFWRMDAPFAGLASFSLWLLLNTSFLWAGILLYFFSHTSSAKSFSRKDVVRALLSAAPVFLLAYFATFVTMNLLIYPGPVLPRRTMTPLSEIFDLRVGALALRLPYFFTLVCALWEARPRFVFGTRDAFEAAAFDPISNDTPAMFVSQQGDRNPASVIRFLVIAGLINALIVAVLFLAGNVVGWWGLGYTILFLFLFLTFLGFTYPNAAALALAPFSKNAGTASALLGFFQLGIGALASVGVSVFSNGTAMPMVAVIAGTSVLAVVVLGAGQGSLATRPSGKDLSTR